MKKTQLIPTIVIALLLAGGSFYAGMQYQKNQRGNFAQPGGGPQGFRGGNPGEGNLNNRRGGSQFEGFARPISGEITSLDNETITVQSSDGSSQIIIYSDSTKVNKTSEGSISDLQVGEKISVMGSAGTDNIVNAQVISLGNDMARSFPVGADHN